MDQRTSQIGTFLFIAIILFVGVFFLIPFQILPFLFLGAGLAYTYILYKDFRVSGETKKRTLAIITLISSVLCYTLISIGLYGPRMQLLMEGDPLFTAFKALEIAGMAGAFLLYSRWFGLLLIYAVIYIFSVLIAFILRRKSFYEITQYIGYLFFIVMIGYNILEILMNLTSFPDILINLIIPIPFVLWYTIEFAIWFMSGWTFITNIFSTFIERTTGEN